MQAVYLDHNATTPIDPRVVEAMTRAWRECGANPASQHGPGRNARRMLEAAREGIAELLGAKTGGMDADQVIFTSGGTEANNLALFGLLVATKPGRGDQRENPAALIISPLEHSSITRPADELRRAGIEMRSFKVAQDGMIDVLRARELIDSAKPQLVCLMLASNETGIVQPVAELSAHCRSHGTLLHADAAQAVGKIPVRFRELGADLLSIAPHKFHGPLGIGALVVRHGIKPQPQLHGGFQQAGLRPGTENVALAVGLHEALRLAVTEMATRTAHMQALRDKLEEQLVRDVPDALVIGKDSPRLPNTSCIAFPGVDRQQLVIALDLAGVACSTGSACASGSSEPSPALLAMGLPKAVAESAIRLSLGAFTTPEEAQEAASRISKTVKALRSRK